MSLPRPRPPTPSWECTIPLSDGSGRILQVLGLGPRQLQLELGSFRVIINNSGPILPHERLVDLASIIVALAGANRTNIILAQTSVDGTAQTGLTEAEQLAAAEEQ